MRFAGLFLFFIIFSQLNAQSGPAGDGLTGSYYRGYAFDSLGVLDMSNLVLDFSRVDSNFDIWNGSQYFAWQPVSGWSNNYSVEWSGYIYIEESGLYGFGTISDDGSQLLIDDKMVVDNGESQWYDWEDNISEGDTSNTPFPPLFLNMGFHKIVIKFAEWGSYDGIEVWWIKPSQIDSSDIPWYGQNFHATWPSFNTNTNWEILPKSVLYTKSKQPPVAVMDSYQMPEDSIITFNPYRNDHDPESTAIIISGYGQPLHGLVQYIADSTFSYQPDENFFGSDSFQYYIMDEYAQVDTGVVHITVYNVPDKPADFHLLSPANNYTTGNDWNIIFSWSSSQDADNDTLNYYLNIFNNSADTTIYVSTDTSYTFDGSVFFNEGTTYNWTVRVNDAHFLVFADTLSFSVSLLVSVDEKKQEIPLSFKLEQNYPNPFNPATIITYQLPEAGNAELVIFDILGKKVATLVSGHQQAGYYRYSFDAGILAGGVYFYRLQAGDYIAHRKMLLTK